MATGADLVALEERGWQALSSDGPTAAKFYRRTLETPSSCCCPAGSS